VPDVHGAEVGAVRVGIANTLNDRYLSLIIESLDRGHIGVEAQVIIDGQDLVFRNPDVGAIVEVQRVSVRYDGVQNVVAAR
jgi:hypothetical protein